MMRETSTPGFIASENEMGKRPICACTLRRSSVIIFCADLESNCVKLKEVRPWRIVANRTARTIGVSTPTSFLTTTLSTKYFVEAGSTNPDKRLMAMSRKPSASNPRLGFINAQTSGRFFHVFLRFSVFDGDLGSFSAAMICGMKGTLRLRCPQPANIYTAIFYGGTKLLNLQRFLCEV